MLTVSYVTYLIVNAIGLMVVNIIWPEWVVLGTWHIPVAWAVAHSMGALALINILAKSAVKRSRLGWWIVNSAGIWLIARAADQFGMGIASWRVAVWLGLVVTFGQAWVMREQE